jgi:hypothetical protein
MECYRLINSQSSGINSDVVISTTGNAITFELSDRTITFDYDTMRNPLRLRDKSMVSYLYTPNIFLNRHAFTYPNKLKGKEYYVTLKTHQPIHIQIPYENSPSSEWKILVNNKDTCNLIFNGSVVTNTIENESGVWEGKQPTLAITNVQNLATTKNVTVQLKKDGANLTQAGVEVFAETTVGQLNRSRSKTDVNGICNFIIKNADAGDSGKIKVGFQFFSGEDEATVTF